VRARLSIVVAVLALIGGVVVLLSQRAPQRTGLNGVPPVVYVYTLQPRQTACQFAVIPPGTRSVGLFTGTYGLPGPPLRVVLAGTGIETLSAGGYKGAETRIAIPEVRRRTRTEVCLTNRGLGPLALAGVIGGAGIPSTLDGRKTIDPLQLIFYGPTSSYWARGPVVASRVGLLSFGGTGGWLFWCLVALMLAVAASAVALIARQVRE
jgi:hypothetical protein